MAAGVSVANAAATALAFVVTAASLYYVSRQEPTENAYEKGLFIGTYLVFDLLFFLGLLRTIPNPTIQQVYGVAAPSLVFWAVVLLTFTAYSIYFKPQGAGFVERMKAAYLRWPHGLILAGFVTFIAVLDAYSLLFHPFTIVKLTSFDGAIVDFPSYNTAFLYASVAVLAFFAYPTGLLFVESRKTKVPSVRRALKIFPLCWIGIGASLWFFQGYLVTQGYDLVGVSESIISVLLGVTALIFRESSVLSGFYGPLVSAPPATSSPAPVEKPLDVFAPVLLMVDPSTSFEMALGEVARGKVSSGNLVYVFTSKGSPLHYGMEGIPGVRFYLMTGSVSYAAPTDKSNELLIPQNEPSVILDMLDKTISTTRKAPVTYIFDSISDLVLYLGAEDTYKFLKQAQQLVVPPNLTSIYLLTMGAQDERTLSLVKSLFRLHAVLDQKGVRMTKGSDGATGSGAGL